MGQGSGTILPPLSTKHEGAASVPFSSSPGDFSSHVSPPLRVFPGKEVAYHVITPLAAISKPMSAAVLGPVCWLSCFLVALDVDLLG